jgi:hypothetical protein
MFKKYAINLLQEVSGELEINAYCCKNAEDREMLEKLSKKLESIIKYIENPQESAQ